MFYRLTLALLGLWAGAVGAVLAAPAAHSPHTLISTVRSSRYDARTGITMPLDTRNYALSVIAEAVSYAPAGRYRLVVQRPNQALAFLLDDYQARLRTPLTTRETYIAADTFAWTTPGDRLRFLAVQAVAGGRYRGVLAEIDIATRTVTTVAPLTPALGAVYAGAFSPSGGRLGVWGGRGQLTAWDATTGEVRAAVRAGEVAALRWRDERHLLYTTGDCVRQWDTATGAVVELLCTATPLWELAPAPDGATLALAWATDHDPDGVASGVAVGLYDFATGALTVAYETATPTAIVGHRPLAWSPDGRYVYSQFNTLVWPNLLHLTDARTGRARPLPVAAYFAHWETTGQLHDATH